MLLLRVFTFTSVFTGPLVVLASTTETVVGVAGGRVLLPCRSASANKDGVDVCWGRGEPSLFTCHNTVINSKGGVVKYRSSNRFSTVYGRHVSMSIYKTQPSDSGFYHCRVQLPGLFNDQTFTVHLIVISPQSVVSDSSESANVNKRTLNTPRTTVNYDSEDVTAQTGSDITTEDSTGPMVAQVQFPVQQQQQQQLSSLQTFIGNTVRVSFIIFIPAVLLTAAHRVWISKRKAESARRLDQTEEEETRV